MPIGTQSYYRPKLPPNTSPSGRGIDPRVGSIGSMPGGMDFLAGFGPAPSGVNLAPMAPIQRFGMLPGGGGNRLQAYLQGLSRFAPATNRAPNPHVGNQWFGADPMNLTNPYSSTPRPTASTPSAAPQIPVPQTPAAAPPLPTIQWAGSGMPYAQMDAAYKQMTAGLKPWEILNMFPSTKP